MLADIEQNALDLLKSKGLRARDFAVQKGADSLVNPAVHAAIEAGAMTKVSKTTFRQEVELYLYLTFKNLKKEKERREGLYPILEGAIQLLLLQTLDLTIDPLVPVKFANVTTEQDTQEGKLVFYVQFKTFYYVEKVEEEAAAELLQIGLNYYLKPGDDEVDATDIVELNV